jgi:hypothetical protein
MALTETLEELELLPLLAAKLLLLVEAVALVDCKELQQVAQEHRSQRALHQFIRLALEQ